MSSPPTSPVLRDPNKLSRPFAYIVCYELTNEGAAYQLLREELERSFKWMHYLPGVWFILRYDGLADLGVLLRSKVYTHDKLLVMPAVGPSAGFMPTEVWTWLNENLPKLW